MDSPATMVRIQPARVWIVDGARFDEARRELRVGGQRRNLEAKPLALLHTLLCRAGEVATKDELLRTVWPGVVVTEGSLTTAISKLRAALGPRGRAIIEPVHGIGYRIGMPIELAASAELARLAFTLRQGETVPNRPQWRLERRLAASEVWLVRHEKTAERRVFKFADTAERLEDLKREAALCRILAAALGERPDLVRPIEWNFDTRPWYLESPYGGLDLPAWAAGQGGLATVPLAERVAVVASVARAVAAAHQVGVLHRDIKPANILIAPAEAIEAPPQVRLVDFGAGGLTEAARLEAAAISGLDLTGSFAGAGARGGTLRYMAPEVIAGGQATMASDVYALGILLYQMVVADLDRPLAAGWEADIGDALLRNDIEAAAAGNPDRRLRSVATLADRLETLDARRRTQAASVAAQLEGLRIERQLERVRMRRPWLLLASVLLLAGSVATAVSALHAADAARKARREARIVVAENSFLADDLLARGDPARSGRPDETLTDAAIHAEASVDTRFHDAPVVAARLHAALANAFDARTAWGPARAAYDRAIADYTRAEGNGSPSATLLLLERIPMEIRSYEPGALKRVHAYLAQAGSRLDVSDHPPGAEIWLELDRGLEAELQGDFSRAITLVKAAADKAWAAHLLFTRVQLFRFREREAHELIRLMRIPQALAVLDRLQAQQTALLGSSHPETLITIKDHASALVQAGRFGDALDLVDRTAPVFDAVLGPTHRDTIMMLADRGAAERLLGRYDAAVRDGLLLHDRVVEAQGPHAFYAFASLSDVAMSQCRGGKAQAGVATAEEAWRGIRAVAGDASAWTQLLAETLSFCLIADHRGTEALPLLTSLDPHVLAEVLSDPTAAEEPALMRADIAYSTGDVALARSLLAAPRVAYAGYKIDPYYAGWALKLATSIDDAAKHPPGRFATQLP